MRKNTKETPRPSSYSAAIPRYAQPVSEFPLTDRHVCEIWGMQRVEDFLRRLGITIELMREARSRSKNK